MEIIVCKICNRKFKDGFGSHLKRTHKSSAQQYYDDYFKQAKDGVCLICNKPTLFSSLKKGYKTFCSSRCANKGTESQRKKKYLERYGVENPFASSEIKQKIKQTNIEKFGVENPSQSNEIKEKKKNTTYKNFGVENPSFSKEIREKAELTNIQRYGAENVMHVKSIAEKAALNGGGRACTKKYLTKFGNEINVQGSYEKKFVFLCEKENIYIENGPCVKYKYENKERKYFVDFQIKKENSWWLVEIKSSYWFEKFKNQIEAKKEAAIRWSKENNFSGYYLLLDNIEIPKEIKCL